MSVAMVVALVLLPVAMYGLALLLASCRDWLGVTGAPRARNLVRSIRLTRERESELQPAGAACDIACPEEMPRAGDAAHSGLGGASP